MSTAIAVLNSRHYDHTCRQSRNCEIALWTNSKDWRTSTSRNSTCSLDYEKLRELCTLPGLHNIGNEDTTPEAHREFMENYKSIFLCNRPISKRLALQSHSMSEFRNRKLHRSAVDNGQSSFRRVCSLSTPSSAHIQDSSHFQPSFLTKKKQTSEEKSPSENAAVLRKLLKKLPISRSKEDNKLVLKTLKLFPGLTDQVEPHVLKELSAVAKLDVWDENVIVYGNTGYHIILHGNVLALYPLRQTGADWEHPCPTPEPRDGDPLMTVGDCFGTLEPLPDGDVVESRTLSVCTIEPGTELLVISAVDYEKVLEKLRQKEEKLKLSMVQNCPTFKTWSRQPLLAVVNLIKWIRYPPNTVLVEEGDEAGYIAIVKTGECQVLRKVNALVTLANSKQMKKLYNVETGKLVKYNSFCEQSVLSSTPMTYTVRTTSLVELAVIQKSALQDLDSVTLQLLRQSSDDSCARMTQDDVHEVYVEQERRRQWNQYKRGVLAQSMYFSGVAPGSGKWKKAE